MSIDPSSFLSTVEDWYDNYYIFIGLGILVLVIIIMVVLGFYFGIRFGLGKI